MLVYVEDKKQFLEDVENDVIDRKIETLMAAKLYRRVGNSEK